MCSLLDHLYVIMFKLGQSTDQIVLFVALVEWLIVYFISKMYVWPFLLVLVKTGPRYRYSKLGKCLLLYYNALVCILFILWFLFRQNIFYNSIQCSKLFHTTHPSSVFFFELLCYIFFRFILNWVYLYTFMGHKIGLFHPKIY